MKNIFRILVIILFIFLIYHCTDDKNALTVLPSIKTIAVTQVSCTTATAGGNVTNDGGSPVISRGVCWSTSFNPTITDNKTIDGSGSGAYSSNITKLYQNTFYYLRAYAINSAGISYGNQENFITSSGDQPGTVADAEGNHYDTVVIGTQTWMKENLKTTKYNNGSPIPMVTDEKEWGNLTTPGYCWYNNDLNYKTDYGALYNWYALDPESNGHKNLCPTGWHVPTYDDWAILINYLGRGFVAVGKLKEAGTTHWQSPNIGATNESGFTGLPGGCRDYDGTFYIFGWFGYWWSSTEFVNGGALCFFVGYDGTGAYSYGRFEKDGFSVRCIKDN